MAHEPTTNRDLKHWLLVTIGGIVVVGAGLAWDAAQHAADPDLASHEGPLTLTNPSHALAAVGLLAIAGGLLGSAWTVWHPPFTSARAKAVAATTGAAAMSVLVVGGAWAISTGDVEIHADHAHGDDHAAADSVAPDEHGEAHAGSVAGAGHQHPTMAPYDARYAAATDEERAAADALLTDTRSSLARYTYAADAVADGYLAPGNPVGQMHHYRNPGFVRDGVALDPNRPEGLVYQTVDGRDPVLVGAFFVAPRGTPAPIPAGDLVVWHSHDPSCTGFIVTADEPCTDTMRMLHVWTTDEVELVRRLTGETVPATISDPFGAPFHASISLAE
ncbi:MAG: hypothetical protein ACRD0A_02765 [Acidimicrobiales bacterium]